MMIEELFNIDQIEFNSDVHTKEEALQFIASFAEDAGIVKSAKAYHKGLKKREKEVTTGFKDGIAIPHCKHKTVQKPSLMIIKFSNAIDWESMDGKPVHITFALAIPEGKNQDHLKLLSTISRALIDEDFVQSVLNASTKEELYQFVQDKLN